jgi:DNA adenine methylase
MLKKSAEFCDAVALASLDLPTWRHHREVCRHPRGHTLFELGFSTFYLNRCNRSGILNAGVIGGQSQKGSWRIDARFPRNELIRRIEAVAARRRQIAVSNCDAEAFMRERVNRLPKETLVYCDPPYYERAERLYLNAYEKADHQRLARFIQRRLKRHWMVSYDDHADIRRFYQDRRRFRYALQYSAVRPYEGTEVFIFSDDLVVPPKSQLPYVERGLHGLRRSA